MPSAWSRSRLARPSASGRRLVRATTACQSSSAASGCRDRGSRPGRSAHSRRACPARSRGRRSRARRTPLPGCPAAGQPCAPCHRARGRRNSDPTGSAGRPARSRRSSDCPRRASPSTPHRRACTRHCRGPGMPVRFVDMLPSLPSPSRRWIFADIEPSAPGRLTRKAAGLRERGEIDHPGSGAAWKSGTRSPRRAAGPKRTTGLAWILGMPCRHGLTGDRAIKTRSPEGGGRLQPPMLDACRPGLLFQYTGGAWR